MVELVFGEWVCVVVFEWVLRCDDMERGREVVCDVIDVDFFFVYCLE